LIGKRTSGAETLFRRRDSPLERPFEALLASAGVRPHAYDPRVETGFGGKDLKSSLRSEFELLSKRVVQQQEQAERLRQLADQVEEQTGRDEHLLAEMASALGLSAQLRIDDLSARLRGQRLREVAVEVLETQWGADRDIHYREWFDLVQAEGYKIGGKDPLATFLSQVHRADEVEGMGHRSGRYRLVRSSCA
jgi:hypothetical protein